MNSARENLRTFSTTVILENQHPSGAYAASPNFSQYGYSWLRDGSYIAFAMLIHGEEQSAHAFITWVAEIIERYRWKVDQLPALLASGRNPHNEWFLSARYTLEGEEDRSDWPNFQIDGYGSWLWLVGEYCTRTCEELPPLWHTSMATALRYLELVWKLPNSDCWEEFPEHIHPATLACLAGGAGKVARLVPALAERAHALTAVITAFIREAGEKLGYIPKFIGSETIDASLLWLAVPFGVLDGSDPLMVRTVKRIEAEITVEDGVKRYLQDTYYGGGRWIILSAFLGWYYLKTGNRRRAEELLAWIIQQAGDDGHLPEQVLDQVNDPSMIEPWVTRWGKVATPLLWSHAMFLILDHELAGGEGECRYMMGTL